MSASACPDLKFAKPAPRNREKRVKVKAKKAKREAVDDTVDARDKGRCRLTGRRGSTTSIDPLDRLHRHHILQLGRDQGPDASWNLVTVHTIVHDLIHENVLTVSGDADDLAGGLTWTIKAEKVVEAFGRKRVPAGVRVVANEAWQDYIRGEARIR